MLKFLKYFGLTLLALIVLAIILNWRSLISAQVVYSKSLDGKYYLEQSLAATSQNDFKVAISYADEADSDFKIALDKLKNIEANFLVKRIDSLKTQTDEVSYLLETTEILSKSLSQGLTIGKKINDIVSGQAGKNYSELGTDQKQAILKLLYESGPDLNGIKANLDLALLDLKNIDSNGILHSYKEQITATQDQLTSGVDLVSKAIIISQILPSLVGYPNPVNYLVILQNNGELRPTGGFLGTVGTVQIYLGDFIKFATNDSYHLDMPASLNKSFKVTPPWQIKQYLNVDRWYLRDSNWSPDWPTSAQKIQWFYETEAKFNQDPEILNVPKFDGVVAITPKIVSDLLGVVGPVTVNNQQYTKDNFVDLLQFEVEQDYYKQGISQWDRKKVIAEILKELKIKLFNLPSSQYLDLIKLINKNIQTKDFLIYFNDPQTRALTKSLNWEGEIKSIPDDYLMVVDANLAAYKTDRVMDKTIVYNVTEKADGLYAKVKINYDHNGKFDWKTTRYRTYVRVYVPLGSKLISSSGLSEGNLEVADEAFFYPDSKKTYFGGFIGVNPGHDGSLEIEYKLPDNLKSKVASGTYSLYVQRQPGNNVKNLNINLNFNNKTESYNSPLETDHFFELKF